MDVSASTSSTIEQKIPDWTLNAVSLINWPWHVALRSVPALFPKLQSGIRGRLPGTAAAPPNRDFGWLWFFAKFQQQMDWACGLIPQGRFCPLGAHPITLINIVLTLYLKRLH